jgi:predicted nucleotidyltransferase
VSRCGTQRATGGILESEPESVTDRRDRVSLHLDIDHERVAELCRRNPIRRLAFFGSVLRDDFGPQSDVDVLVEFTPRTQVTLLDMVRMQDELSAIIGRRVDLRTKGFLSRYFRDEVVAAAEVEFVA